jgi:substrate import-associated zinc metallohydrolase lipoprotein
MKKIIYLFAAFLALSFWSCGEEELNSNSIFDTDETAVQNSFDKWLYENYTVPYNIDFKYRFEDQESDRSYNLAPADVTKSIALAKLTKYLWIESYVELMGGDPTFIRTYCPKIMHLVGSPAYNSQGSVVLGTAEGGLKITLYNVNMINVKKPDIEELNYWFFKTMHHEFAHILHQTKEYSTDFNTISPGNYQAASWVNLSDQEALNLGFISKYASSETQEDFVEIIAVYVTSSAADWDALVARANADGRSMINAKLALVRDYLKTSWSIDLDALRDIVQRRSGDVLTMDLTTLN